MDVAQITPRVKTASPAPIFEYTENDQAFPAGMWRTRVNADAWLLERATEVDWTAVTTALSVANNGDITLVSGVSLISAGAINLKVSGDSDDYLSITTVAGIPTITATGADYLALASPLSTVIPIDNEANIDYAVGLTLAVSTYTVETVTLRAALYPSATVAPGGASPLSAIDADLRIRAANDQNWGAGILAAFNAWVGVETGATGTLAEIVNIKTSAAIDAATVTDLKAIEIKDPTGAGTVTNAYGLYINALTKGATINTAIYVGGGKIDFAGVAGIDFTPGSDVDVDLLTVAVTGTPRLYWEEAQDKIHWTNGLWIDGSFYLGGGDISSGASITVKPSGDNDDFFTLATVSGIPTIYGTGAYLRIGDAAATSHSLASEDDLMVSGKLEVDGVSFFDGNITLEAGDWIFWVDQNGAQMSWRTDDANAAYLLLSLPNTANKSPQLVVAYSVGAYDLGLFDGTTQPSIDVLEKSGQYSSSTSAFSDAGAATPIMKLVGGFTASVVGDIVRVTAGTADVPGWYWITTVTSANEVVLDRNWTTGNCTGGTFVAYHSCTMLSAEGICTRITDGAPTDASVEIDRDGWLILDVGQANGRLYWRANNAWHYVDATAGLSFSADERIMNGHTWEVDDFGIVQIDKHYGNGAPHGLLYPADRWLEEMLAKSVAFKAFEESIEGKISRMEQELAELRASRSSAPSPLAGEGRGEA